MKFTNFSYTHTIMYFTLYSWYVTMCYCTLFAGFQNHGRNFEAVSKMVVTKTVAQCKNFFFNYKRKYNLPKLVADYEIRNVSMYCKYVHIILHFFTILTMPIISSEVTYHPFCSTHNCYYVFMHTMFG